MAIYSGTVLCFQHEISDWSGQPRSALSGKAPPFPEEDMEQRKKAYLDFVLGEEAQPR